MRLRPIWGVRHVEEAGGVIHRTRVFTRHCRQSPTPVQGDFVLKNFKFRSGETLTELRLHYRTLGRPERDARGVVRNAVLILHGTSGSGAGFMTPEFGGQLFGAGALLDASRYFIILPDGIGHGQSSKPSDGLRARFPRYRYGDMIEAQHRLLTEGLGSRGCEETPERFRRGNRPIEVDDVLDPWLAPDDRYFQSRQETEFGFCGTT